MSKHRRLNHQFGILAGALAACLCASPLMAQAVQPSLQSVAAQPGVAFNPANAQAQPSSLPAAAPASQGVPTAATPTAATPTAATPAAGTPSAVPSSLPIGGQAQGVPVQVPSASPSVQNAQQLAQLQAGAQAAPAAQPGTFAQQGGALVQPQMGQVGLGTGAPPLQVPAAELPPLPTPATAFPKVMDDHLGVTPEQVRQMHQSIDDHQRATNEWLNPPRSVRSSISVSLSPGAQPPVIRPYMGAASSFVVIDSTGQPWPVENVHPGNPALFTIDRLDGPQGSSFTVDALQPYGQSNLILKLVGVATPVVINLTAGQRVQDASVEVRVQGRGPNAMVPTGGNNLPAGTDARLLPVLDGIAPAGATSLTISGADNLKAWMLPNGHMLVRAPFKLLSPVIAATSSSDGTTVYELAATPKLLGLVNGNYVNLTVSGW